MSESIPPLAGHGTQRFETVLLTGFPSNFLARHVLAKLLVDHRESRVICIVPERSMQQAVELVDEMPGDEAARVQLLEGDTTAVDLGLSGKEFLDLAARVDLIHHCAFASYQGIPRKMAERINVQGTQEVLELVSESKRLVRFVHWSTAFVSGLREGFVAEDELLHEAGFHGVVEETRYRAEKLVRRKLGNDPRLTVLRPTGIVGDSRTGEIDRLEGPYLIANMMLNTPSQLNLPLPGNGHSPLHMVPLDFVLEAGFAILRDPRSAGRTFHIADPDPKSANHVFAKIAQALDRPVPMGSLPAGITSLLLRTPLIERYTRVPQAFLGQLATRVVYDDRSSREILRDAGVTCPKVDSYIGTMATYARMHRRTKRAARGKNHSGSVALVD